MTFEILNYSSLLNILQEESTQLVCECPVCGGHRLTIRTSPPRVGAYQCWSGGCKEKDIREAIAPWSEVQSNQTQSARKELRKSNKQKTPEPALISSDPVSLGTLPHPVEDIPQRQQQHDPKRGVVWKIQYPYFENH